MDIPDMYLSMWNRLAEELDSAVKSWLFHKYSNPIDRQSQRVRLNKESKTRINWPLFQEGPMDPRLVGYQSLWELISARNR